MKKTSLFLIMMLQSLLVLPQLTTYIYPGDLNLITYGDKGYLAVGRLASMISKDGEEWKKLQGTTQQFSALIFWKNMYIGLAEKAIMGSTDGATWKPLYSSEGYLKGLCVANNKAITICYHDRLPGLLISSDAMKWEWIELPAAFKSEGFSQIRLIKGKVYLFGMNTILLFDWKDFVRVMPQIAVENALADEAGNSVFFRYYEKNPDREKRGWRLYECSDLDGSPCCDARLLPGNIHVNIYERIVGEKNRYLMQGRMLDSKGNPGRFCVKDSAGTWSFCQMPDKGPTGKPLEIESVNYLNGKFVAVGRMLTILTSPDGKHWSLLNYDKGKNRFYIPKQFWPDLVE